MYMKRLQNGKLWGPKTRIIYSSLFTVSQRPGWQCLHLQITMFSYHTLVLIWNQLGVDYEYFSCFENFLSLVLTKTILKLFCICMFCIWNYFLMTRINGKHLIQFDASSQNRFCSYTCSNGYFFPQTIFHR